MSGFLSRLGLCVALGAGIGACASSAQNLGGDALKARIAKAGDDWEARRFLIQEDLQADRLGSALDQLLIIEGAGQLEAGEHQALATLLRRRGQARIRQGDAGAIDDLDKAEILFPQNKRSEPALALAALYHLRHSSAFVREKASGYLRRLMRRSPPGAPRDLRARYFLSLGHHPVELEESSSPRDLEKILAWLYQGNAKRQALGVAKQYVSRGGREPGVLKTWIELHRWWYGDRIGPLPSTLAASVGPLPSPLEQFKKQIGRQKMELANDAKGPAVRKDIAEVYGESPEKADKLAASLIAQSTYNLALHVQLAETFYHLGDTTRAKKWTGRLASLAPQYPPALLAAALGCIADNSPLEAEHYALAAAASSGDPGHYWAIITRALRRRGHHVEALVMGRRALSLTSSGNDLHILKEIIAAQFGLKRIKEGAATLEVFKQRLPQSKRQEAVEMLETSLLQESEQQGTNTFLAPIFSELIRAHQYPSVRIQAVAKWSAASKPNLLHSPRQT